MKNTEPAIYVFDIEGTLLDGYGELRPGATEMFTAIRKERPETKILFESGMNEKEVKIIVDKILSITIELLYNTIKEWKKMEIKLHSSNSVINISLKNLVIL